MMAMSTKMAKNEPKTISIFFWPFWGFGSSTGMGPVSHPPSGERSAPRLVLHRPVAPRPDAHGHLRHHEGGHERDRQSPAAAVLVEHAHQEGAGDGDQVAGALREGGQLRDARAGPGPHADHGEGQRERAVRDAEQQGP